MRGSTAVGAILRGARRTLRQLYAQILLGVGLGAAIGHFWPDVGLALSPLGTGFIRVMRMMVPPIIFCTIVNGIVGMRDERRIGGTLARALVVFFALTLFAIATGFLWITFARPGAGLGIDLGRLDPRIVQHIGPVASVSVSDFVIRIIPDTFFSAFTTGEVLPVLFIATLIGLGLLRIGDTGLPIARAIGSLTQLLFAIFDYLMRLAPIGAFGAIAYSVAVYGVSLVGALGKLIFVFYCASATFGFLFLLLATRLLGIGMLPLLRYFKEEILIIVGTASTEAVLPRILIKLERLGCARSVAGLVLPAGYSFNLSGTAVYLPVATLFMAQALGLHLPPLRVAEMLAIMVLTSKTGGGVTGSGFSALITTLTLVPEIPVAAVAIIVGGDRIMSEGRALTSGISNFTAALLIAAWDRALDHDRLRAALHHPGRRVRS